jgi:tetratricopeptide (TPR) repeat protein
LLEYKTKAVELENKIKAIQAENESTLKSLQQEKETSLKALRQDQESALKILQQEKENTVRKLQEEKDQLGLELGKAKEKVIESESQSQEESVTLQQKVADLERKNAQLNKDKTAFQDSLEKLEIEYKIIPEIRKKVSRLEKEKSLLLTDNRKMEQNFKRLEESRVDKDAQIEIYRMQIKDLKKQYDVATVKNRGMQAKLEQMPVRFAELARENKVLIKETALMHYNLGVFYTKNKEYPRAIAEFEKTIELNPDDPYAHYNLGYIYAEYLIDRPKAIEKFREFLQLCKTEDNDVDWVKKYILTWQTWEGKKPMN